MTFRILVVCAANICRSPVAAALLRQSLASTPLAEDVHVTSCGEHAWRGLETCAEIVGQDGLLGPEEAARHARHHPAQLTTKRLLSSDLVLTADRAVRSTVVRLQPQVHDRAFTLREAAALANHVVRHVDTSGYGDTEEWLGRLVREMNDSRGLIPMPAVGSYPRTFLPWPRLSIHGHDIPDSHEGAYVPHRIVRVLLDETCADLAKSVKSVYAL